jgi:hypothetical protein
MKVLLINPPMQIHQKPEFPSMGLSFIAQALRKAGHDVKLIDIDGYRYTHDEVSRQIEAADCDLAGIGA